MSGEHTPSISDEEEDDLNCASPQPQLPELQGTLSKWTNYLHGWQERWVVLSGGTLSYYKTEYDTAFGCRGSMSVAKATIQPHEFDECRFDVSVNDCVYYLRAADGDTRQKWVDALGTIKAAESGYGSESSLRKGGSLLSLSSVTSLTTTTSGSSFKKGRGLHEKLMELETFRDIVCQQIDTLQNYFDACAGVFSSQKQGTHHEGNEQHDDLFGSNDGLDHDADDEMDELSTTPTPASSIQDVGNHGNRRAAFDSCDNNPAAMLSLANLKAIDFRGEAITFKATTSGILVTLQHCIDVMNKREENLQRRLDRETEKRKKAEAAVKAAVITAQKRAFIGGPDFEEGPHSVLNEEEFYDAIEVALDRQDEEDALDEFQGSTFVPSDAVGEESVHRLTAEVNANVKKGLQIILENVDHNWYLVHEDGEMKVYRREYEEGGVVLDPMKATHIVEGVTAREMANYFFDKGVRLDWDSTLETAKVVEQLSESTLIMYQVFKRMWPSSQRDTCFVSHIRNVPAIDAGEKHENEVGCPWLVCNYSVEHPDAPQNKYVRAIMAVTLFCQTLIEPRGEGKQLNRDLISCKMTYTANINPGGWAPPSVVRAVSKREYPKFLRKISSFCQNACKDKPISM